MKSVIADLLTSNRSYRRFDEQHQISREVLASLISLASLCPSAANLQSLRYCLVHEAADRERIFPHIKWAAYLQDWDGPAPGQRPTAYIVVLNPLPETRWQLFDAGIIAQSILLGAVEKGLGGCMLAGMNKQAIHQILQLPDDLDVLLVIALGKPAERVQLEPASDPNNIRYFRSSDGVHHVPKLQVEQLLLAIQPSSGSQ